MVSAAEGRKMMRLIDADLLIEGRVENDPVVIATKCAQTAYDPDRVVEQLEEERENVGFVKATTEASAYIRGINDAIKIVKGGGIDG